MLKLFRVFQLSQYVRHSAKYVTFVKMPALSPTMTDGGIVTWHKKEGDEVSAGDMLCDIQTDKAVIGLEADEDGVLAKIIKPNNTQNLKIGAVIAMMAEPDEDWKSVTVPAEAMEDSPEEEAVPAAVASASAASATVASASAAPATEETRVGPAVRRLLDTYGLTAAQVCPHSGPRDILTKADVLQFVESGKLSPVPQTDSAPAQSVPSSTAPSPTVAAPSGGSYIDLPLSSMRQTIAKRMVASKTAVPHHYTTGRAHIDRLMRLRKQLKLEHGTSVSVNDFIIKACAYALRIVPEINSQLSTEGAINPGRTVDISVAVASESGLITPIVFRADQLSISQIGSTVKQLAEKARNNKLQPKEFMGGSFTISNLGMFGIKEFTAIINSPQAAILAVGAGLPELVEDDKATGAPNISSVMRFTLSADARLVSQADAGRFLHQISVFLENPELLAQSELDPDRDVGLIRAVY